MAPVEVSPAQTGNDLVVLVVDDEEIVRRVTSLLLEHAGYRVFTAADADEAIAVAEAESPDVVLLDVMLRGRDGGKVAAEMRGLKPDLPIVVSSGYDEHTVVQQVGEIAGSRFIRKPYRATELVAVVAEAVAA